MVTYHDPIYNIILPQEYLKNIYSYNFTKILTVKEKDYLNVIQKDFFKDYYCAMIDKGIEENWGESLIEQIEDFNSPYDYFVIDRDDMLKYLKPVLDWFLADLVYFLDMGQAEKFDLLYNFLRSVDEDYIIKVQRIARNLGAYPIYDEEIDEMLGMIEGYEYKFLLI